VLVRPLDPDDYPAVAGVFAEGIATGLATFETSVPTWEDWDAGHLREHRFVAELDGEVVGWVAVVPYSRRAVYRGVGEESVNVAERARGRGVGRALLEAVIESARDGGLWTLQAGIFPDNLPSRELHRRLGFREIGVRERIGQLDGVWRDVTLLELRL
jgi:L-amino acid N-acyltransferase YncA